MNDELPPEVQDALGIVDQYLKMNAEPEQLARLMGMLSLSGPPGTIHTELDDKEIAILALMDSMNDLYKSKIVGKFIDNYIRFRISRKRKSRMEMVDVIRYPPEEEAGTLGRIKDAMTGWTDR